MASFTSILDRPSNAIDRTVKQLPPGHYTAMVIGQPREDKSSQKGTPFLEYTMKIMSAAEDVDEEALDEYLTKADGGKKRLQDCTIRNTYYLTDTAVGRLLTFLDHLDGLTPGEAKEIEDNAQRRAFEAAGKSCVIQIKHEPWQSGEGVSARVAGTAIVE